MHLRLATSRHHRAQRGDTIIEVLISIAVVSLVLGGAYVTTNQSLKATRAAQERGNALKLVESQLEQLKAMVDTNASTVFATSSTFCIYNNGIVAPNSGNCTLGTDGTPTQNEPKFQVGITRTNNDFVIRATWTDVGGDQSDEIQMSYRAYQ